MRKAARTLVSALCLTLSGCYFVSYEDVSEKAPFSDYVGKEYTSTGKIVVDRVSMDPNYKADPSVYIIYAFPGAAKGPEFLSLSVLPRGTTIRALKVMRCTNCYLDFEERVHLVVKITSSGDFQDTEVRVSTKLIGSVFVETDAANKPDHRTPDPL